MSRAPPCALGSSGCRADRRPPRLRPAAAAAAPEFRHRRLPPAACISCNWSTRSSVNIACTFEAPESRHRHLPPAACWVSKWRHNKSSQQAYSASSAAVPAAQAFLLVNLRVVSHLRGLLRMPSCWSRASGATADGCSGADMSMDARTAKIATRSVGVRMDKGVWEPMKRLPWCQHGRWRTHCKAVGCQGLASRRRQSGAGLHTCSAIPMPLRTQMRPVQA